MLYDPRVRFEHNSGHMSVWCDDGPVVDKSRELWAEFEDQPKVDASYPGLQIPHPGGQEICCYRVKVIEAARPQQFARKGTVKDAVSLKLGWAYEGASFHPGKWDQESWSISGMGSVCCDGYQKPWFYPKDRKYPIGFTVESSIETAVCRQRDGSIDIFFRVDGFDIQSPLVQASRWNFWSREPTPVFRIPASVASAHRGLPMPAVAGGINFGPGWRVELEREISPEFYREVLGETPARVTSAPSAPSVPAEEPEEPPRKKLCCRQNPVKAKFCMECGEPITETQEAQERNPEEEEELQIIGFSVDGGLEERIEDDDWDALRALVHRAAPTVKQEDDNVPFPIVEVPIKDVWPLQKNISRKFRNGQPLQSVIDLLNKGHAHPMSTPWLVLNMAKAELNGQLRYYTFDHRRCWCMFQAGVKTVRARILLQGRAFNDLVRKSDNLGARPLDQLGPRGWR